MRFFHKLLIAATVALSVSPSFAQTQGTVGSVPTGKGAGFTGYNFVAPGTAGYPFVSNGALTAPSFQILPLAGGGLGGSQAAATANQVPVFPGSGGAAVPTVIAAYSVNGPGCLAASNGTTNDAAAVAACNTLGSFSFNTGTTRIASVTTLTSGVHVNPGALILVDGVTLTINGPFDAQPTAVFTFANGGNVVFGSASTPVAYSEWWGAKNDGVVQSATAINAALQAHLNVRLLSGTYLTTAALLLNRNNETLCGAGKQQTTINIDSATLDAIQIQGFGHGTVNGVYNVKVCNLQTNRLQTPTTPANTYTGNPTGAAGIRVSEAVYPVVDNVFLVGDFIGVYLGETVNLYSTRVEAVRSAGVGGDRFYGWYIDGFTTAAGAISPNASTRIEDSVVGGGGFAGTSVGFYMNGSFADQYLLRPETSSVTIGIELIGPTGQGQPEDRRTIDVQIIQPIIDGIPSSGAGIYTSSVPDYGAITVIGGYGALGAASAGNVLFAESTRGLSIGGGFQFIGWPSNTGGCANITSTSNQINIDAIWQDCVVPVAINASSNVSIKGSIYNKSQATGLTAVSIIGGTNNLIDVGIDGAAAGQFANGVLLDGTTSLNEVRASRIVATKITKPVSNNGTSITNDGRFGTTNLASGLGVVNVAGGGTGLSLFTQGGIPWASATDALSSTALLAANALMIGGGTGAAPSTATTGTGVLTALGVNVGSDGAFVVGGGALGTPSSGTLTNATGLPAAGLVASARQFAAQGFTTSGTFTTPSGSSTSTVYKFRMCGGGAGSGGTNGTTSASGGGGGGEYVEGYFSGIAASTGLTITIGAGGTAGDNTGGNGGDGGTTTIGTVAVTAIGGAHSNGVTTGTPSAGGIGGTGGAAGSATVTLRMAGGLGGPGLSGPLIGGFGGSSPFGSGGNGAAAF
ncbi:MAG: hypothetical protein Q7S17_10085, partial [Xanthobacteraceae bacterium]|nr:hypothetical protein [Xanthobacteraceae bacterium]